ncbi:putative disease resistance protein At3g14460 [Apium graveolens]|uniref:putative disease resistance protein At3g14460 n=1 Tax=Apium graveolens TaxID=4045 RepID=UPI003D7A2C9B
MTHPSHFLRCLHLATSPLQSLADQCCCWKPSSHSQIGSEHCNSGDILLKLKCVAVHATRSSLRLSYDNLPNSSLKRCFVFCSILPKGSKFFKDELIHTWMPLGFLLPPADMHDLVHDLALDLSKRYSMIVNMDHELNHMLKPIYGRVNEEISGVKLKNLKTNFERVQVLYAGTHILNDVLPYSNTLTTLVLKQNCKFELPSSMSNIMYLKLLDISTSDVRYRLPNFITRLYNLQTLRVTFLEEIPKTFCNLINLRHFVVRNIFFSTTIMFTEIERLTFLQTMPHFIVSRDQNCLIRQLGELYSLRGNLTLHGLRDVENIEEARKAKLHEKPNIQCLRLDWSKNGYEMESHNRYGRDNIEYNDEDGRKFTSWITMMTNLVKLKFVDCENCEKFLPLGQLPKLREMGIFRMNSIKVMGSSFHGDICSSNYEFSGRGAANKVTTLYPLLTKLTLWGLCKVEEWLEPEISTSCEDRSNVLAFPKLEVLEIYECPKLKGIPDSCFPSLKQLRICNLDSSNIILETMRINARSLMDLELVRIRDEGGGSCSSSSSNAEFIIDQLLKNNSQFLTSLKVCNCEGLTCLNLGVALEKLEVIDCFDLSSITFLEHSCALSDLTIGGCSHLTEWLFDLSLSSMLVRLTLGPFSEELDEFPLPFPSSFPNLISQTLHGWEKVKSIVPQGHINDCLSSTFQALILLQIYSFQGVKALPDSLAKLPSLTTLTIKYCKNLESFPTFDESRKLRYLRILMCPLLERYRKEGDGELLKIQHISTCMPFRSGSRMLI